MREPGPYDICREAVSLFIKHGFEGVSMQGIARSLKLRESQVFTWFGNREDIILFLYWSINADWQHHISGMGTGNLEDRFEEAMKYKMELMLPYVPLLNIISGRLMQAGDLGVQSERTTHLRAMGIDSIRLLVSGSRGGENSIKKIPALPELLYSLHWLILLKYLQKGEAEALSLMKQSVAGFRRVRTFGFLFGGSSLMNNIAGLAASFIGQNGDDNSQREKNILRILFNHRKLSGAPTACSDSPCRTCFDLHLEKVKGFTHHNKPLHFILPAFPAKSPNYRKVLGTLPDLGEEIALTTLEDICREIGSIYQPGARITICSDGRIFSSLVGITDEQAGAYVQGIRDMIERLQLRHVEIVNLEDLTDGSSFDAMREEVLRRFAEAPGELKKRIKENAALQQLFNGIHRFITEDRKVLEGAKSLSSIKEESKAIATEVIRYSNAWTRFLAWHYPEAIRLSIHPYPAHSDKIGIRLTKAGDNWITPWHGVIVLRGDGYILMKKSEAEELKARLVEEDSIPRYYTLLQNDAIHP